MWEGMSANEEIGCLIGQTGGFISLALILPTLSETNKKSSTVLPNYHPSGFWIPSVAQWSLVSVIYFGTDTFNVLFKEVRQNPARAGIEPVT